MEKSPLGNYGTFIGIAASALVILVIFGVTQLEVYERTKWVRPSRETWSNNFYVIGKWLSETGHPVRFRPRWTGIKTLSPRDGALYLQASLFDWEEGERVLLPWVREGGVLLISIDAPWYRGPESWEPDETAAVPEPVPEPGLEKFLANLGVTLWYPVESDSITEGDADEFEADMFEDDMFDEGMSVSEEDAEEEAFPIYDRGIALELAEAFFAADRSIAGSVGGGSGADSGGGNGVDGGSGAGSVGIAGGREPLVLRDQQGTIRLVRLALGKGYITVTGECYFMYTRYLSGFRGSEENARAAWEFTGGSLSAGRPGMLFIRGRRAAGGFFETLAERGNLMAPVVSILVLLLTGFWMVIPVFGIPLTEGHKRRGSIVDRFRAEARFLSRHGALRIYLETYLRELRRRSGGRNGGWSGGRELGRGVKEVEDALAAGGKIGRKKMAVYLKNLMSALERI
jgi:hypothetical protein